MTRRDIIRGHLDLLVLSILREGPSHGYAVAEELRTRSNGEFDLPEGTVYPALYRLEEAGLLSSRWETQGGRPRRVYEVTSKGRKALTLRAKERAGFFGGLQAC